MVSPTNHRRTIVRLGAALVVAGAGIAILAGTPHSRPGSQGVSPSEVQRSGRASICALPTVTHRPCRALTPGALNPEVTQDTIGSTICVSGWTATVRPPASYTTRLKIEQIAVYGYTDTNPAHYEEDHLIPLELGGAPRDPLNLWPQPYPAAHQKDLDENGLRQAVCAGTLDLHAARTRILQTWGP